MGNNHKKKKKKISVWFIKSNNQMYTVAERTNFGAKGTPRSQYFYNPQNYLYD